MTTGLKSLSILSFLALVLLGCNLTDPDLVDEGECDDCFFRVTVDGTEYDISDPVQYYNRVQTYIDTRGEDYYGVSATLEGDMHHYLMGIGIRGVTSEIGLPDLDVDSDGSDYRSIRMTELLQSQIVSNVVMDSTYNNRYYINYIDSTRNKVEGQFEARFIKLYAVFPGWTSFADTVLVSNGAFRVRLHPRCVGADC